MNSSISITESNLKQKKTWIKKYLTEGNKLLSIKFRWKITTLKIYIELKMKLILKRLKSNTRIIWRLCNLDKNNSIRANLYLLSTSKLNKKDHSMANYFNNLIEKESPCSKPQLAIDRHSLFWIKSNLWWKHHLWSILKRGIIMNLDSIGQTRYLYSEIQLYFLVLLHHVVLYSQELMTKKLQLILDLLKEMLRWNYKLPKDTLGFMKELVSIVEEAIAYLQPNLALNWTKLWVTRFREERLWQDSFNKLNYKQQFQESVNLNSSKDNIATENSLIYFNGEIILKMKN